MNPEKAQWLLEAVEGALGDTGTAKGLGALGKVGAAWDNHPSPIHTSVFLP